MADVFELAAIEGHRLQAENGLLTSERDSLLLSVEELERLLAECQGGSELAWPVTGLFNWTGSGQNDAMLDKILSSGDCAGLAALIRWNGITNNEINYDWSWFDRALAAGARNNKPVTLMVILGANGNGIPASLAARLPSSEEVSVGVLSGDVNTFPVFWSQTANAAHDELIRLLCDRYRDHPNLAMLRVTGFWRKYGEPWTLDTSMSDASVEAWMTKYRAAFGQDKTFTDLQNAYDQYEYRLWERHSGPLANPKVRLAGASGYAFRDQNKSVPRTSIAAHPRRHGVYTKVRVDHGNRASFQFNSANAISGDFGVWLPSLFGPDSPDPGVVGAQPVGGVTSGAQPLTFAEFDTMLKVLAERKHAYVEVYGSDWAEAVNNPTGAVAASIHRYANSYAPS